MIRGGRLLGDLRGGVSAARVEVNELVVIDVAAGCGGGWPSRHTRVDQPVVHRLGSHPVASGKRAYRHLVAVVELGEHGGLRPDH